MRLVKSISDIFFPHYCVVCREVSRRNLALCIGCENELPWNNQSCYRCGEILIFTNENLLCGKCIAEPPPFDSTIAIFKYQPPIDRWITQLKFHEQLLYSRLLGQLLSRTIQNTPNIVLPQLIIPVPLHNKRLRERGFNQALEISRTLSRTLKIPIDKHSMVRIKDTLAQSSIPAEERRKNIKKAFILNKPIEAKHIAIVDDVITTGSTVNELALSLKKAGTEKITIWSPARAVFNF